MSSVNLFAKTISPLEKALLKTYLLSSQERIVSSTDKQVTEELAKVDNSPISGNQDGKTSILELKIYLDIIAAYEDGLFHSNYSNYRDGLNNAMGSIGDEIGIELIDPYAPENNSALIKYTLINTVLLSLLDHPQILNNADVITEIKSSTDINPVELLKMCKTNSNKELTKDSSLSKILDSISKIILANTSDEKKIEYINKLIHSPDFLHIKYSTIENNIPLGKYGSQMPSEILNQPTRKANCFELSGIAMTMLRTVGIPALINDVDMLIDQGEKKDIDGIKTIIPEYYQHAIVEVYISNKKYYYDASQSSQNTTFNDIETSDYQKIYNTYTINTTPLDSIYAIQTFYIESSREQAIKDIGDRNYNFPSRTMLHKTLEGGFIADPFDVDEDFFEMAYKNKEICNFVGENVKYSPLFLDYSPKGFEKMSYSEIINGYVSYNPYNFNFIESHLKWNKSDSYLLNIFQEDVSKLTPFIINNITYLK